MTSVYLTNVTGDGASPNTAYQPDVPDGTPFACLMIHEAKRRAVIVSPSDTLTGTGVTKLLTGASFADLRTKASNTNPTAAQRTTMNNWLTANGYTALTAAQVTWWDYIHHIARQINSAADLDITTVA